MQLQFLLHIILEVMRSKLNQPTIHRTNLLIHLPHVGILNWENNKTSWIVTEQWLQFRIKFHRLLIGNRFKFIFLVHIEFWVFWCRHVRITSLAGISQHLTRALCNQSVPLFPKKIKSISGETCRIRIHSRPIQLAKQMSLFWCMSSTSAVICLIDI